MQNNLSYLSNRLVESDVIRMSSSINKLIKEGRQIYNLTIGDYDSNIHQIPHELKQIIIKNYNDNNTNYPPAIGESKLINELVKFYQKRLNITSYSDKNFLITCGGRPAIYAIFNTLLNNTDSVIYPLPSWNNNNYSDIINCNHIKIPTTPENNFMLVADDIKNIVESDNTVKLLCLCSPQNPTGTVYTDGQLKELCDLILNVNKKREIDGIPPIYIMFDQIYWLMTFNTKHITPNMVSPEVNRYVIYVDGISKYFAATGVRVGWCVGDESIISKAKNLIGHIGAWSPKPEQLAVSEFLKMDSYIDSYVSNLNNEIHYKLNSIYNGIKEINKFNSNIDVIEPMGGLYLSVKIDIPNMSIDDIFNMLLDKGIGILPFYAFGYDKENKWFRLSVGTLKNDDIVKILNIFRSL